MGKNRNLIILSIYLFALISSGVVYTSFNGSSKIASDLRIDSIQPVIVIK